mgnify:FL=1
MKYKYFTMHILSCLCLIAGSLLLSSCAHLSDYQEYSEEYVDSADIITDQEIKRVEQIKLNSTGMLKKAFGVEEHHRKLTLKETKQLLGILSDRFKKSGLSVGDFEDQVLERINRDLEIINAFNKKLDQAKNSEKDAAFKLCKQNELLEVISGSEDIVSEYIDDMVHGILPEEFEESLSKITTLERNKADEMISGSFRPTCFKGAILTMLATLSGERANASKLNLSGKHNPAWVNHGIVFHSMPMPGKINKSSIHPDFESFTYFYKDASSPSQGELVFPHSGYFPDGQGVRKPHKGLSNPEDCSSWVFHRILNAPYSVTSYDVMQFYRIKTGVGVRDGIYAQTPEFGWLNAGFIPALKPNVKAFIKPGDIICLRRPEEQGRVVRNRNYGISGHVAIALFATDTHIIALACTRDVPLMEGVGIQKLSLEGEKNSDLMIFRRK